MIFGIHFTFCLNLRGKESQLNMNINSERHLKKKKIYDLVYLSNIWVTHTPTHTHTHRD